MQFLEFELMLEFPSALEPVALSFAKGGSSVLADAYLAGGGSVTVDQAR